MISYYNCITSQEFLSMWASASNHGLVRLRVLRFCASSSILPINPSSKITTGFSKSSSSSSSSSPLIGLGALTLMENNNNNNNTSYFSTASAQSRRGSGSGGGGGRGRGSGGGGAPTKDRIDPLGILMTRILRHMASELNLDMRSDGYVKVDDLLKLNLKTFANVPLRSHTIDEIREAVRKDNKQRFSLLEENGELLICANQGHSTVPVQSESLLQPILSAEEAPGFSKSSSSSLSPLIGFGALTLMEKSNNTSYFSAASAQSRRGSGSGGGGGRGRGSGGGGGRGGAPTKDRIDALGRLMTRILRHMASELNLDMRSDGYVKVDDLLKLNLKTFANVPLRSHTIDEIREAVRKDNKQRFSLLEENGELLIRANQGHSTVPVQSESLLQPILSAEEAPVCVHGTYKRNLESILQTGLKRMNRLHVHFASGLPADGDIISGMRRDVNVLIFLDVRKALEEGMKLYISDNKVILTEGFDGIVPIKYFKKIETWPSKQPIPF